MPTIMLSSGHIERQAGELDKVFINAYVEAAEVTPAQPSVIRALPGIVDADSGDVITGSIRCIDYEDGFASGKLLIVDGTTLRTFDGATWSTITGTLTGADRAQIGFSEIEAAFLSGGELFVSDGSTVAAVTDTTWDDLRTAHGETEFSSICVMGQRLIATYGSQFAFSDAADFDNIAGDQFYTSEKRPDRIVAGVVHGEELLFFGTRTIEVWVQTGDNQDPFSPLSGRTMPDLGALNRDCIETFGSGVVFIDQHGNVRRMQGVEAPVVSKNWLTRKILEQDAANLVANKWVHEGHYFYVLRCDDWCYAYDLTTNEWIKLESYLQDSFDWSHFITKSGVTYIAHGGVFGKVDNDVFTQMGLPIVSVGVGLVVDQGQSGYSTPKRGTRIGPIHSIGSFGAGETDLQLSISFDGGFNYSAWRDRSLGDVGNYSGIPMWNQNGISRGRPVVIKWRHSGAVNFSLNDMICGRP